PAPGAPTRSPRTRTSTRRRCRSWAARRSTTLTGRSRSAGRSRSSSARTDPARGSGDATEVVDGAAAHVAGASGDDLHLHGMAVLGTAQRVLMTGRAALRDVVDIPLGMQRGRRRVRPGGADA